jgi:hypothetical protein
MAQLSAAQLAALIDDVCQHCGAGDEPHAGDCPVALAQDFEDSTLRPGDDSYNDGRAAYEALYGGLPQ